MRKLQIEWAHNILCPFSFHASHQPLSEKEEMYISTDFDQNCTGQYKCIQRFLQPKELANKLNEIIDLLNKKYD